MLTRQQQRRLQALVEEAYTLEPRLVKVIEDSVAQTLRQAYEDSGLGRMVTQATHSPTKAPAWLATLWGEDTEKVVVTPGVNLAYRYGDPEDVNERMLLIRQPGGVLDQREIARMYGRLTAQVKKTALPNLMNVLGRRTARPAEEVLKAYVEALKEANLGWQAQNIGPNKGGVHFHLFGD